MRDSDIKDLAKKYAKKVNNKFHRTYRTRWNITNMVENALLDMGKDINDEHKFCTSESRRKEIGEHNI